MSRNPPGTQSLILARRRGWLAFRAEIKGIDKGLEEEDDEDKVLPDPVPAKEDWFHEDLYDNWRRSADPERSLGTMWTGRTDCERADGNWIPFEHEEPREALFIPPTGEVWTGRRHTVVKFVRPITTGQPAAGGSPAPPPPPRRRRRGGA